MVLRPISRPPGLVLLPENTSRPLASGNQMEAVQASDDNMFIICDPSSDGLNRVRTEHMGNTIV
jgi:hypothetical protein